MCVCAFNTVVKGYRKIFCSFVFSNLYNQTDPKCLQQRSRHTQQPVVTMASLASTVAVKLKWGKKKFTLDVDTGAGVNALNQGIFALTNVPADRQKLMCKGVWKGVLSANVDFSALKFKPKKSIIVLMGSAASATNVVAEKVVFLEDMSNNEQAAAGSSIPPGLSNLGNTCYMNSTIQCLRAIPQLCKVLDSYSLSGSPENDFGLFLRDLSNLYKEMAGSGVAVTPFKFVQSMRRVFPQFGERGRSGGFMQQDAEELLGAVFTALRTAATKNAVGDGCAEIMGDSSNALDAIFGLEIEQVDVCQESETEAERKTTVNESKLRVNIDGGASSSEKIDHMFQGMHKALKSQVERNTESLGRNAIWNRTQRINRLPQVLCIQYMRFYWKKREPTVTDPSTGTKCKMLRPVAFPATIDMYQFCSEKVQTILKKHRDAKESAKADGGSDKKSEEDSEESAALAAALAMSKGETVQTAGVNLPNDFQGEYEIFAVVSHKGRSADAGHYIGWVRQSGDTWMCFDDDQVDQCATEDVLMLKGGGDRDMGYMLFYRAKE